VVSVLRTAELTVAPGAFLTAEPADVLTVLSVVGPNGGLLDRGSVDSPAGSVQTFNGARSPDGVQVPSGATLVWSTNAANAALGFTLCTAQAGQLALRPDARFFELDLPTQILVRTLPRFASVPASDGATLALSIARLLHRFSNAANVRFFHRLVNHTARNATLPSRFANTDPTTGSIMVFHGEEDVGASFHFELLASDSARFDAGRQAVVYSWQYTVVGVAPLIRTPEPFVLELNGVALNESQLPTRLAIGRQYRFGGPAAANPTVPFNTTHARFFQGTQGQIAYKIESSEVFGPQPADGDVLINTATASIFVTPSQAFTATFVLSAFDESGRAPLTILTWTIEARQADTDIDRFGPNGRGCAGGDVVDDIEFNQQFSCRCREGFVGDNCEAQVLPQLIVEYHGSVNSIGGRTRRQVGASRSCSALLFTQAVRTKWAIGRAYGVGAVNITGAVTSAGTVVNISNVTFQLIPTPPGFFIDSTTGSILGQPTAAYNSTSELRALLDGTQPAILANITFEFLAADTDTPANGPNGAGCGEGGSAVDAVEFDGNFTCQCIGSYTGDNCETFVVPQLLIDYHGTATSPMSNTVTFTPITRRKWAIDRTYQVYIANVTNARTADGSVFNVSAVRFQLHPNPPGFFMDGDTGAFIGQPPIPHNVSSVLRAVVDGTLPADLATIQFEFLSADVDITSFGPGGAGCLNGGRAVDFVEFDEDFACDCTDTGYLGNNCEILGDLPELRVDIGNHFIPFGRAVSEFTFHNQSQWVAGDTYQVAPINVSRGRIDRDPPNISRAVSLGLRWSVDNPPDGFFVDGLTGEMLVKIPSNQRSVDAELVASSPGTVAVVVENLTFNMLPKDTANASNGPNGRDCANSDQHVDSRPFDGVFTCNCTGFPGSGDNCDVIDQASENSSSNTMELTIVLALVGALVLLVVALVYRNRRLERWKRRQPHSFEDLMAQLREKGLLSARDGHSDESAAPPVELPRNDLVLLDRLGKGNFGEVHKGLMNTRTASSTGGREVQVTVDVAVKSLLDAESSDARDEFLREAAITWHFQHRNVVAMHGVVTSGQPYLLVLELCVNGALKDFLVKRLDPGIKMQYSFLLGIAQGMEHLTALGFVHRDLAARNVLLDRAYVPKIADFGLGRDTDDANYYSATAQSKMMLPLRWTDPDVFRKKKFSSLTDVWSYGITAIEIFTRAATPYTGWTNILVLEKVRNGYRLPCPAGCPDWLYMQVIAPCWHAINGDPKRPSFAELVKTLTSLKAEIDAATNDEIVRNLEYDDVARGERWSDNPAQRDGYDLAATATSAGERAPAPRDGHSTGILGPDGYVTNVPSTSAEGSRLPPGYYDYDNSAAHKMHPNAVPQVGHAGYLQPVPVAKASVRRPNPSQHGFTSVNSNLYTDKGGPGINNQYYEYADGYSTVLAPQPPPRAAPYAYDPVAFQEDSGPYESPVMVSYHRRSGEATINAARQDGAVLNPYEYATEVPRSSSQRAVALDRNGYVAGETM